MRCLKLLGFLFSLTSLLLVSDFHMAKADHGGYHALPKIIIEKPNIQRRTLPRTVVGGVCPVNLPQRCPPGYTCRHIKTPDQAGGTPTIDPEYACVLNSSDMSCPPGFTMDVQPGRGKTLSFTCTSRQMADPMQWCNSVQRGYMGYYRSQNGKVEFICGRQG